MKHLGDITKIDWSKVEPVDVVAGGSPCQDLSVAGKRAGLAGERSGLYMEQIRCVKELRQADVLRGRSGQFIRPRYMVWENVPGAFSSGNHKGSDFAAVIEELIKVAEPDAEVRVLPPSDGWTKSGCYYDCDGRWSIAWRVHDAQFWGVPQRRKRIALVADFGGFSAPEVLFERKGLSGDFEPCGTEREGTARSVGEGVKGASAINCRSMTIDGDVVSTITTEGRTAGGSNPLVAAFSAGQGEKAGGIGWQEECSPSLKAGESGTNRTPTVYDARGNGGGTETLVIEGTYQDVTGPLMANSHPGSYTGQDAYSDMLVACASSAANAEITVNGPCPSLLARAGTGGNNIPNITKENTVRRLTPLECERLQGYPDGWTLIGEPEEVEVKDCITIQVPGDDCPYESEAEAFEAWCETAEYDEDGNPVSDFDLKDFGFVDKKIPTGTHTEIQHFYRDADGKKKRCVDSARYKALGNSIALPFWKVLAKRISAQYDRDITMGSLFDGIGGFPLVFEQVNGKGTARWASEIEEFPMAVTKLRFGED